MMRPRLPPPREVASRLRNAGCAAIGPLLPPERIAQIVRHLDAQPVLAPGHSDPIALKDRPEGIHKGAVPAAKARLIFQVQYSLLPVYAFDYHPVTLAAGQKFGRHVNRLVIDG